MKGIFMGLYYLFSIVIMCGLAYCISLFLIGFPVAIWEWITKRKVNEEQEEKVIKWATIILSIVFVIRLLYDMA